MSGLKPIIKKRAYTCINNFHVDRLIRISMELSILNFKGTQVDISKLWCIFVIKFVFYHLNSADPDEMPP